MTKSEAQTRSELIDLQFAQTGWNVKDPTQVVEEFDILTLLRPGVAEPRTPYAIFAEMDAFSLRNEEDVAQLGV